MHIIYVKYQPTDRHNYWVCITQRISYIPVWILKWQFVFIQLWFPLPGSPCEVATCAGWQAQRCLTVVGEVEGTWGLTTEIRYILVVAFLNSLCPVSQGEYCVPVLPLLSNQQWVAVMEAHKLLTQALCVMYATGMHVRSMCQTHGNSWPNRQVT